MGNFYVNYTIRGASQAEVAAAMTGRRLVIPPASGDTVVVFDKLSDRQDEGIITELASKLSATFQRPVLAVMNHDDDILWYCLYSSGQPIDQYNSSPDYFDYMGEGEMSGPKGGEAAKLCAAFGCDHVDYVESILRKPGLDADGYVFAFQRHADLVEALGLPSYAVGASYGSFGEGGGPDGLPPGDIVRT